MSIIEKEGKTVEQAIEKGIKELGLSRDEIQVEIVSLGSSGFLGVLGARPAKVRLKVQTQPRVKRIVETILEKMGFPGTVRSFSEEGGRLTAVIESDLGEKYLQANNGAALDALEYLVGKIYHEAEQDVHLDIGGFRQNQGDHLKTMALDLAKKVKESGQEHKLPPMPPHQRKVIHKALESNPDVRTFAVGEGDRRRVIIAPRHGSGQAPRPAPSAGSTSSPQAGSGQTPRPGPLTGSGQRSGQAPRPGSGQAPRHSPSAGSTSSPQAGSGQRSRQAPRPGSGQALPQKQKPQPEAMPKPSGKPGRRDSGRRPPKPMERQEQPVRQAVKPAPAPDIHPAQPAPESGEAGFVPRSKKKTRRP